jgi:hypothetical protein
MGHPPSEAYEARLEVLYADCLHEQIVGISHAVKVSKCTTVTRRNVGAELLRRVCPILEIAEVDIAPMQLAGVEPSEDATQSFSLAWNYNAHRVSSDARLSVRHLPLEGNHDSGCSGDPVCPRILGTARPRTSSCQLSSVTPAVAKVDLTPGPGVDS